MTTAGTVVEVAVPLPVKIGVGLNVGGVTSKGSSHWNEMLPPPETVCEMSVVPSVRKLWNPPA